jgi:6-pyruvoyl-tetrahydropterin synthase
MHWLSGFALFLSGMIVGAAVYMSVHQHNFHELYIMYQDVLAEKEKLQTEIKKMDNIKTSQNVIKSIDVRLLKNDADPEIDDVTLNEIEKAIYQDLKKFVGQKVSTFAVLEDTDTMSELLKRRYWIKDKDYSVQLKSTSLIQTKLIVRVTVKEFKKSD